jgi:type II secretory pathway component PulJ
MLTSRRGQRGLSVVEMMVGVAVGLFVVAAATLVVSSQLSSNRRLLLDTQIQQDLRVAADVITRDLRRAGALNDNSARQLYWYPQATTATTVLTSSAQTITQSTTSDITYRYQRYLGGGAVNYGFRLNGNKLQSRTGSNWQDLTDDTVMKVTSFTITAAPSAAAGVVPCPNLCPGGGTACWPTFQVRNYIVAIEAQAANDATITRSIRTRIRVTNDLITNNTGTTSSICPL